MRGFFSGSAFITKKNTTLLGVHNHTTFLHQSLCLNIYYYTYEYFHIAMYKEKELQCATQILILIGMKLNMLRLLRIKLSDEK